MTIYFAKKNEFIHTNFNDSTIWMNTINSNFVELNETSTFLMGLLGNTTFTEGQLIEAACQEYSISAEDCSKDINEALQELLSAGLLNVSEK